VKICLINPPSVFLLDERVFPSLGLLKVGAVLEREGHDVEVLDLSGIENYLEAAEAYMAGHAPDVVGISSTTPQLPAVVRVAATVRGHRPGARLVLGGPHVTLAYSADLWEHGHGVADGRGARSLKSLQASFDVLVAGDGELSVLAAIGPNPPPIVDADSKQSAYFMSDAVYEASPLPGRHLIDLDSYRYSIDGHRATSLIAQLGCPFSCGFCGGRNSRSLRVPRTRTIQSIVGELEMLHARYGYTGFMFYDDELNVKRDNFVALLDAIRGLQDRLGVEFRLRGFVKAELFDAEQAQAMHRAGFRWLLCGFEAATPRILLNIAKRATIDDNSRAVEAAKDAGLKVKALMSCGHPGEDEKSIQAVRDWLVAAQVDDFDYTIITPYPGTPYHDEAVQNPDLAGVWTYAAPATGDRLHAYEVDYVTDPQYYKGDPDDGYRSYVFTDQLTPEDIVVLRGRVERDVRKALGIPFNAARPAKRFEHSMGQGLPGSVLTLAGPV